MQPIGAHPLVTAYITSLQNEDFFVLKKKGYRYDDTWDTEPFYDEMRSRHAAKIANKALAADRQGFQVEVSAVRDVALGVGRLALACRSAGFCKMTSDCRWPLWLGANATSAPR